MWKDSGTLKIYIRTYIYIFYANNCGIFLLQCGCRVPVSRIIPLDAVGSMLPTGRYCCHWNQNNRSKSAVYNNAVSRANKTSSLQRFYIVWKGLRFEEATIFNYRPNILCTCIVWVGNTGTTENLVPRVVLCKLCAKILATWPPTLQKCLMKKYDCGMDHTHFIQGASLHQR
jgi:hypothetical protein